MSEIHNHLSQKLAATMIVDYVDIVTRTKDRPLLIWRCVESVFIQTHQNWRHIIVNDGGDADKLKLHSQQVRYADTAINSK